MPDKVENAQDRIPVSDTHIWLDSQGIAWVDDANVRVTEIALDRLAFGMDADTIHREYPDLSLAQIHAAFAYYYAHQAELDAQIQKGYQEAERLRAEAGRSPLLDKLRKMEIQA